MNNWFVITGGPSTGKTTLIAELEKAGHKVVPEAARTVIDEAVTKGLTPKEFRADEKKFQETVADLKATIEATLDSDVLTFFDRGMHDTAAYMRYYGYELSEAIQEMLNTSTYRKVFLLDPLPVFKEDYARTESPEFAAKIQKLLHDAYAEAGMEPERVPAESVENRLVYILRATKVGAAA